MLLNKPTFTTSDLRQITESFVTEGTFLSIERFGNGLINDTYTCEFQTESGPRRYIIQRINHDVFKDPVSLMRNVERVCGHIRKRLESKCCEPVARRFLTIIPTHTGSSLLVLTNNENQSEPSYWRCFDFIEGCTSHDVLKTPEQAYQTARKFGEFQRLVADLGGDRLSETIPDFHNTPKRFKALLEAIQLDPIGRVGNCKEEIEFALSHESIAHHLLDLHARGLIPERVTHNDTKLSNVLIDDITGEGMCVVDLDTVMPGLSLYDFGDLVRTCVSPVPEDCADLDRIQVRQPIFKALVRGFLYEMADVLTSTEVENLGFAAKLLTYEVGLRFLTDYILGDPYFGEKRPNQNLERARNQFRLAQKLETSIHEMPISKKKIFQ